MNVHKYPTAALRNWLPTLTMVKTIVILAALGFAASSNAADEKVTLNLKDMSIADVMEMLARKHRVNILLGDEVSGQVSLNLFDVTYDEAISAISEAAGFAVERRRGSYFIVPPDSVGRMTNGVTAIRNFHLNYADPVAVAELLETHLSQFGEVTSLPERNLIIVADQPQFLSRVERLVQMADEAPAQVLIEAQILEVTLTDEDAYGIDWSKLFESDGGTGSFGTQGLFGRGSSVNSGFLFELVTPNVDVQLAALQQEGRVRTLSTPTLVALDNQEASVVIGDRRGYQVTTTINQVTTESIEFLESGVILRVTPNVDASGNIMMDIHPEVSTGTVDTNGIPSQTTTEVTTSLLIPDGETVFIGGLIKHTQTQSYQRVPVLGRVPVLKTLFRSKERTNVNTETIVLITPRLQRRADKAHSQKAQLEVEQVEREITETMNLIESRVLGEEQDLLDDPNRITQDQELEQELDLTDSPDPTLPFAVQVMQMSNERKLREFMDYNKLKHLNYVPVETSRGTAFALLLGRYPTRSDAEKAAGNLPLPLADSKPWIRQVSDFQTGK